MLKALAVCLLVAAASSGCSLSSASVGSNPPAPGTTTPRPPSAVQRAVHLLQHARFGPPELADHGQLLRHIRCAHLSATRIRCRTTWQGHETTPVVFGVHPSGRLYVIVAGPLAIS